MFRRRKRQQQQREQQREINFQQITLEDADYLLQNMLKLPVMDKLRIDPYEELLTIDSSPILVSATNVTDKPESITITSDSVCKVVCFGTNFIGPIIDRYWHFRKEIEFFQSLSTNSNGDDGYIVKFLGQFVVYGGKYNTQNDQTLFFVNEADCTSDKYTNYGEILPLIGGIHLEFFPMVLTQWMNKYQLVQLNGDLLCQVFTQIGVALQHLNEALLCYNRLNTATIAVQKDYGNRTQLGTLKLFDFGQAVLEEKAIYKRACLTTQSYNLNEEYNRKNVAKSEKISNTFLQEGYTFAMFLIALAIKKDGHLGNVEECANIRRYFATTYTGLNGNEQHRLLKSILDSACINEISAGKLMVQRQLLFYETLLPNDV